MTVNGEAKPQHTKRAARGWRKRPLTSIRVGKRGLEPPTPTMSTWCSNQLSYLPVPPSIASRRVFDQTKSDRAILPDRIVACGTGASGTIIAVDCAGGGHRKETVALRSRR